MMSGHQGAKRLHSRWEPLGSMTKKLKSDEQGESDGYNYFENLPDELFILIFTKLSSGKDKFLNNIKLLGRCSSVSKRFNALTCLVPTLLIQHGCIDVLYKYCPMILKKFQHIRSLRVTHWSRHEIELTLQGRKRLPIILWRAAYRPHGYCIASVSYNENPFYYDSQEQQSLMLSAAAAVPKDDDHVQYFMQHTLDMFYLHHMLVSSIKDHKYLQRVVVTDRYNRGMLTLKEDMLVELRNCPSTNLEQVLTRNRGGSGISVDVPLVKLGVPFVKAAYLGVVKNNVCFNIIEWWEKATDDHVHKDDEDDGGIPSGLPFKFPEAKPKMMSVVLKGVMENPDDVKVMDGKPIVDVLSKIKSDGYLF